MKANTFITSIVLRLAQLTPITILGHAEIATPHAISVLSTVVLNAFQDIMCMKPDVFPNAIAWGKDLQQLMVLAYNAQKVVICVMKFSNVLFVSIITHWSAILAKKPAKFKTIVQK